MRSSTSHPRAFSLGALQRELESRLHPLPCPAMPTLKKWSASGLIAGPDLLTAASTLESAIKDGRLQVRGPRETRTHDQHLKRAGSRELAQSQESATHHEMLSQVLAATQSLMSSAESIGRYAQRIAEVMEQHPHATVMQGAASSGKEGASQELLRAIEQLDATRRHILSQWDAYRQTFGGESPRPQGGSTTGSHGEGPDFLEWQRLQGRMNRMEQMLTQLLDRSA